MSGNEARPLEPWREFDALGDLYQHRPPYPRRIAEGLQARLPPRDIYRILEVGAGTGLFSRTLAEVFGAAARVVGLEPNDNMRQQAVSLTPVEMQISYEFGTAEDLHSTDRSFDLVAAANAVHRFNRREFYKEAARVLEPCGVIAFTEYQPDYEENVFADEFLRIIEMALPDYSRLSSSQASGNYKEIDIVSELESEAAFEDVVRDQFAFSELLDWRQFNNWALSLTTVQRICAAQDVSALFGRFRRLFEKRRGAEDRVELLFRVETITALKRSE